MEINFTASQKFYMTCVKRPISFFGALIGLILLSPIFITTVILLHFANKGAGVFFTQNRPGKNEKIFKALKFKTMMVTCCLMQIASHLLVLSFDQLQLTSYRS